MPHPLILILGSGDAPEKLVRYALDDQLAARAFHPLDMEFFVVDGEATPALQAALDWTAEYEGLTANVLEASNAEVLLEDFRNTLSRLNGRKARVLVFWDESTATRQAVQAALDADIEVYDVCQALVRIHSLDSEDNDNKEGIMPTKSKAPAAKTYTRDDLVAMEEPEITKVAESHGIDHASFDEWDPVIEAILEAQGGEPEIESTPDDEAEEDEEGASEGYTRAQLEAMTLDTLKEICALNEIEVEGQRPRSAKYVEAILDFQGGEPEEAPAATEEPAGEDSGGVPEGDGALEAIEELSEALGTRLGALDDGLTSLLRAVNSGLERLSGEVRALADKVDGLSAAPASVAEETPAAKAPVAKKAAAGTAKKLLRKPSA